METELNVEDWDEKRSIALANKVSEIALRANKTFYYNLFHVFNI